MLGVYASEPDSFDDDEVEILSGLAADVSFGISALRNVSGKTSRSGLPV